jgi:DNA-binding transcriptional LysR family regulator
MATSIYIFNITFEDHSSPKADMQNFPTDLLRSFVAVVEHGGFSQAGNVIGRSQPAMSLQIKRLESMVGSEVIRRSSREVVLTETGELVMDYALRILGLNDELQHRLQQSQLSGTVRLGIPNEFAMSYLPQILAGFTRRYPDVRLEVVSQLSCNLLNEQAVQQLDLVIAFNEQSQARASAAWTEELVWVQSSDAQFEQRGYLPLVVAPQGCMYRDRMLETLNNASTRWQIVYTGSSYGGIRAAVMAGLGVTALAKSTVPGGLKIIKQSSLLPSLQNARVSLHFLSNNPDQLVRRLADFILQSATT